MTALPLLLALAMAAPDDPASPIDIVSALETVTVEAIARAQPSVVAIARIRGDEPDKTTAIRGEPPAPTPNLPQDNGEPKPARFDYAAPGDFSSGVVIGADGAILTTYHSLRGAAQIWVRTADRKEFEAVILAADPRSDLAVIAPRDPENGPAPKLKPMKLADATRLRPGTFLIALGNSFNAARDGKASAGLGILANTTRKIHAPATDGSGVAPRTQYFRYQPTLLQLDAKLNLGMSGGAVVNMKGELVGITTSAASPVAYDLQAGYAIPMDTLGRHVAETLRQGKEVEYGFLGIRLKNETPNAIDGVGENSPAEKADLQPNDLILAVGDRTLDEEDGLTMALATVPAGSTVKLKVRRGPQVLDRTVFVSKYPVSGQVIATNRPRAWRGVRVDFTSVLGAEALFGQGMTLRAMGVDGVGVTDVEPGSAAEVAGLRKGMIIAEVDGQPVATPSAFARAMERKEGKPVIFTTKLPDGKLTVEK